MVANRYDKYRIEDMKRINSRYYLVEIHGKSYIIDYFDSFDFKNYFPFRIFYQNSEKSWKIYDVTGEEEKYKAKKIPWTRKDPATILLMGLYPICIIFVGSFFYSEQYVEGVVALVIVLILVGTALNQIRKSLSISVEGKQTYVLFPAKLKKIKLLKLKQITVILLFISLLYLSGIMPYFFLFLVSIVVAVGNVWENSWVMPDRTIKYKIIEKEEN